MKRVTVTLPEETVDEIDRHDSNRSHFIQTAVAHELEQRRRRELDRSLDASHDEADEIAEAGFEEWAVAGDEADLDLVDVADGTPIRWLPGRGWVETES